jgi:large subunit ribosomal protein L15
MDKLSNLKYAPGSRKNRKKIGRGEGSGRGGTATKGMNGQLSRSGVKKRAWFEGGQMPLQRRVPKFGFTNIFKTEYQVINLNTLQRLAESKTIKTGVLKLEDFKKLGLISTTKKPVKILGKGELKSKINIEVNACSRSAKEKIESAGGTIKILD